MTVTSFDFRAKIEADYAKKLKAWNEKMIKALEASTMYGSHQKGLITITAQSEKIANHHQQIHDKIHSDCSTRVGPYNCITRDVTLISLAERMEEGCISYKTDGWL